MAAEHPVVAELVLPAFSLLKTGRSVHPSRAALGANFKFPKLMITGI